MGHATRSSVVLEHLLSRGHEIKVVVSGKAHHFLKTRFSGRPGFAIEEIHGITLRYFENKVDKAGSLFWNLINSPKGVLKNVDVYRRVAEQGFRPRLVISDFESWAALYGLNQGIPVVGTHSSRQPAQAQQGNSSRQRIRLPPAAARHLRALRRAAPRRGTSPQGTAVRRHRAAARLPGA